MTGVIKTDTEGPLRATYSAIRMLFDGSVPIPEEPKDPPSRQMRVTGI